MIEGKPRKLDDTTNFDIKLADGTPLSYHGEFLYFAEWGNE